MRNASGRRPHHRVRFDARARDALVLAVGAVAPAILLGSCSEPEQGGTRVVLVTLDTTRYDCVAGGQPAMARLAADGQRGTVFEQCYAASSSTQPTHASIFTGLHPWQHGVPKNGTVLEESARTVTEVLAAQGWWTGGVVASFPLHRRFGFAQGFAAYDDDFVGGVAPNKKVSQEADEDEFYTPGRLVTDRALDMLDDAEGDRQFLWVHYFDPHSPYGDEHTEQFRLRKLRVAARERDPGLPGLVTKAKSLYDHDAGVVDRELARLLRRLREDERWQTHVVITADHGESFGDDGSYGHGTTLSDVQVHVPLIVFSDRIAPGTRADPVGSVDVTATLLSLAGMPQEKLGHGRDLCAEPPATAPSVFGMRRIFLEPRGDVQVDGSVRELEGTLLFYALVNGHRAIGNSAGLEGLAPDDPAGVLELFSVFEAELASRPTHELLDADTQDRLRQLGYTR